MSEPFRIHRDENCDPKLAVELRNRRIDVTTTYEVGLKGANDRKPLEFADSEQGVIVSHDGDMIKLHRLELSHHGIIYSKMNQKTFDEIIEGIMRVCSSRDRESMIRILVKLADQG